jgi:6-phosphogluconate dehydrogenase
MSIAEGEELRRKTGAEGSTHPAPAPEQPGSAAGDAANAGPSSGTGSTS